MQFEYALGTKMGQVLNMVQNTINTHRKQLHHAFISPSVSPNNSFMDMKMNTDYEMNIMDKSMSDIRKRNSNKKEQKSEVIMDDPLGAMNGANDNDNKDEQIHNEEDNDNDNENESKKKENPLIIIEDALAELKLVKDTSHLNYLTQLES